MTITTTTDKIAELAINLLQLGVPATIIAKAFTIDTLVVKNLQAELRITHYGASEIAELLQGLMFTAYEEALKMIKTGTPAVRTRMVSLVLGKGLALVGRQSPEEFDRLRQELGGLLTDMQGNGKSPALYADPDYSPGEEDVDDDDG